MRKVVKPALEVADIISDCVSNMREGREKFTNAIPAISEYSQSFDNAMLNNNAYGLVPHNSVTDDLSRDDMVSLYADKFAKKGQPGRCYYDKIKLAPTNGTCPLCGIGQVATLDHYMAKTLYPTLAVTPNNLIPACRDCNEPRGAIHFQNAVDLTLHPYYDEVQNIEWLSAKIISTYPICLQYDVSSSLDNVQLRNRLVKHLDVFHLKERYAKKAAEEICAHKQIFQIILNTGGIECLRNYFSLLYSGSYVSEKNSWRTAMYKALINVEKIVVDGKIAI